MERNKIQRAPLKFEVFTKATEPLEIPDETLEKIREGVEELVKRHVDMRYMRESYIEDYHRFIGVELA